MRKSSTAFAVSAAAVVGRAMFTTGDLKEVIGYCKTVGVLFGVKMVV
jgi:hypothetical protein